MATKRVPQSDAESRVVQWLLQEEQPSVRYFTLMDLLDRRIDDHDVVAARSRIPRIGWAADRLRTQGPDGYWERRPPKNVKEWVDFMYYPKYGSTNWIALALSDMGLDKSNHGIRKLAGAFFDYKLLLGSPFNFFHEEVCVAGNTARLMTRFGYSDDRRITRLFDWLIEDQRDDGGWNCEQGKGGTLDCWEALAAFAAIPSERRSPKMNESVQRGAEFYLSRQLFREGSKYPPWLRFHYPNHYYYDILLGLDILTQLGFGGDKRLLPALEIVKKRRMRDGRWKMDRVHPDPNARAGGKGSRPVARPLVIEPEGGPSKWITLRALRVLKRAREAGLDI